MPRRKRLYPGVKRKRRGGYLAADEKYKPVTRDSYEWLVWLAMHERYPDQICDRWRETDEGGGFSNFVHDMGGFDARPRRTYLARTDKTRPFSSDNCHWKLRKVKADAR